MTRRRLWIVSGAVAFVILFISMTHMSLALKKDNAYLKARQRDMLSLSEEFLALKSVIDSAESRKSLSKVEGIMQAVDEMFRSVGLSEKVKSVKSGGTVEKKYGFEEEADIQIEKVSMNEMVNIFYKIESAPMALSIKKATVKTSFENPALLNVSMTLGFIKPK
jgi:hypothetical protein